MRINNNHFRDLCIIAAIMIGLFTLLFFSSCKSSNVVSSAAELPAFTGARPTRPSLLPVEDDAQIPAAIVVNQVRLQGYIQKLELYCDAWEQYYIEITVN